MQLFYHGAIDREELRQLLRSTVRLHAKTEPSSKCRRLFVKLHPSLNPHLDVLKELFPQAKLIYGTRGLARSLLSARKIVSTAKSGLFGPLGIFWRRFLGRVYVPVLSHRHHWARRRVSPWHQNVSDDEILLLWHLASLACYFDFAHLFDGVVLYEELVTDSRAVVAWLYETMGIEQRHVELGLAALETDSQNDVFRPADRDISQVYYVSSMLYDHITFLRISIYYSTIL